jgi:hypothetical protein
VVKLGLLVDPNKNVLIGRVVGICLLDHQVLGERNGSLLGAALKVLILDAAVLPDQSCLRRVRKAIELREKLRALCVLQLHINAHFHLLAGLLLYALDVLINWFEAEVILCGSSADPKEDLELLEGHVVEHLVVVFAVDDHVYEVGVEVRNWGRIGSHESQLLVSFVDPDWGAVVLDLVAEIVQIVRIQHLY